MVGSLFESASSEAFVKVWRRDDVEKTLVFHGRLAVEEATTDRVAELFGGGYYRAQMFERDERGSFVIRKTTSFKLPGAYKPPREIPLHGVTPTQPQVMPRASSEPHVTGNVNANEALNTALVSQVIDMLKAVREPKANPLTELLPAFIQILPDLLNRKSDDSTVKLLMERQEDQLRELRAELARVREAASTTPAKSLKDQIEDIMAIKELVSDSSGKPDAESMMWAAVPKLLEGLTQGKQPGGEPVRPNPAQQMLADPNVPPYKKLLLAYKRQLLSAANLGISPETAAEIAIKYMPQNLVGVIVEFMKRPDHVAITMQEVPELSHFQSWLTEFFAVAKDMLLGTDEEEDASSEEEEEGDDGDSGA